MTDIEVKEKILKVFKCERQYPNAEYIEDHFMDFLTSPAHNKNTIKGTFRGVRRYYKFMNELELEFGICFSLSDLDKYYSVNELIKKVQGRLQNRRGNIMILKQRNKQKEKFVCESVLCLILIGVFIWQGISWVSISLALIFAVVIYWVLSSKIYNRQHTKKLTLKILAEKNSYR